jgi:hypothetical protein
VERNVKNYITPVFVAEQRTLALSFFSNKFHRSRGVISGWSESGGGAYVLMKMKSAHPAA